MHFASIHNLGSVGHIEDIAVLEDQQGKKLGLYILQALGYIAEKVGCYKVRFPSYSFLVYSFLRLAAESPALLANPRLLSQE